MPITQSAKKAHRSSKRKYVYNIRRKRAIEAVVHEIKKFVKENKLEDAKKLLPKAYKAYDKASKLGTIDKNTASRKKSRLSKFLKKSSK